ncbi:MAG: Ig-like domain-containing protein [Clostridium sp.]
MKKTIAKDRTKISIESEKETGKGESFFSSSKRSVVSVNKTGLVKAKKPGKASITATVKYKGKRKRQFVK